MGKVEAKLPLHMGTDPELDAFRCWFGLKRTVVVNALNGFRKVAGHAPAFSETFTLTGTPRSLARHDRMMYRARWISVIFQHFASLTCKLCDDVEAGDHFLRLCARLDNDAVQIKAALEEVEKSVYCTGTGLTPIIQELASQEASWLRAVRSLRIRGCCSGSTVCGLKPAMPYAFHLPLKHFYALLADWIPWFLGSLSLHICATQTNVAHSYTVFDRMRSQRLDYDVKRAQLLCACVALAPQGAARLWRVLERALFKHCSETLSSTPEFALSSPPPPPSDGPAELPRDRGQRSQVLYYVCGWLLKALRDATSSLEAGTPESKFVAAWLASNTVERAEAERAGLPLGMVDVRVRCSQTVAPCFVGLALFDYMQFIESIWTRNCTPDMLAMHGALLARKIQTFAMDDTRAVVLFLRTISETGMKEMMGDEAYAAEETRAHISNLTVRLNKKFFKMRTKDFVGSLAAGIKSSTKTGGKVTHRGLVAVLATVDPTQKRRLAKVEEELAQLRCQIARGGASSSSSAGGSSSGDNSVAYGNVGGDEKVSTLTIEERREVAAILETVVSDAELTDEVLTEAAVNHLDSELCD